MGGLVLILNLKDQSKAGVIDVSRDYVAAYHGSITEKDLGLLAVLSGWPFQASVKFANQLFIRTT